MNAAKRDSWADVTARQNNSGASVAGTPELTSATINEVASQLRRRWHPLARSLTAAWLLFTTACEPDHCTLAPLRDEYLGVCEGGICVSGAEVALEVGAYSETCAMEQWIKTVSATAVSPQSASQPAVVTEARLDHFRVGEHESVPSAILQVTFEPQTSGVWTLELMSPDYDGVRHRILVAARAAPREPARALDGLCSRVFFLSADSFMCDSELRSKSGVVALPEEDLVADVENGIVFVEGARLVHLFDEGAQGSLGRREHDLRMGLSPSRVRADRHAVVIAYPDGFEVFQRADSTEPFNNVGFVERQQNAFPRAVLSSPQAIALAFDLSNGSQVEVCLHAVESSLGSANCEVLDAGFFTAGFGLWSLVTTRGDVEMYSLDEARIVHRGRAALPRDSLRVASATTARGGRLTMKSFFGDWTGVLRADGTVVAIETPYDGVARTDSSGEFLCVPESRPTASATHCLRVE